ncbi:protein of unknown function [Haloferax larsenii]|uniref:eCIS core domain-containing protein n=1 Tax=Haloferax larsenii TaxID=302484 RepID=A0A1H7USW7_HALLR|nr:protein of unknown function [Haloferax larsenii]
MGFRSSRRSRTDNTSKTTTSITESSRVVESKSHPADHIVTREQPSTPSRDTGMDPQERENALSVRRSTVAAYQDGPAGETATPESVRNVISSPGQSLDTSIQRAMEERMGDSLGDVRIHTGPQAAKACEDINARAFTVGNHIAFNRGEYDPSSAEGQHVLAHELAHVRQQTGGAVSMLPQEDLELEIDPDPQLEREAEETAQRVMEGGELGIQRLAGTEVHIQRLEHGLSDLVPSASETDEVLLEEGGPVVNSLDADLEQLEQLQEQVADLQGLLQQINELSAQMDVDLSAASGETTMSKAIDGPAPGAIELTVSHEYDPEEIGLPETDVEGDVPTGLTEEQARLVKQHKQLIAKFETECQQILDELSEEDIPNETYFREALKEYGKHQALAQILYEAVSHSTQYSTVAEMVQKELNDVGPQAATHVEGAIVTGLMALLTATAMARQKGYFSRNDETRGTRFDNK